MKTLVSSEFWTDVETVENYTPEDKLFYLYLVTNPGSNCIGIYTFSRKRAAFDLGYSIDTIEKLLNRFENTYHKVKYDRETGEIAVLNSLKYSISKGGKPVQDMLEKEIKKVRSLELLQATAKQMHVFWRTSDRGIDKWIADLFDKYISLLSKTYGIDITEELEEVDETAVEDTKIEDIEEPEEVKEEPDARGKMKDDIQEIVGYLNHVTEKNFKSNSKSTEKSIKARIKDGYTLEDFKTVIDNKVRQWKGDPEMDRYLRPQTLFSPSNFESYLNENPNLQKTKSLSYRNGQSKFEEREYSDEFLSQFYVIED